MKLRFITAALICVICLCAVQVCAADISQYSAGMELSVGIYYSDSSGTHLTDSIMFYSDCGFEISENPQGDEDSFLTELSGIKAVCESGNIVFYDTRELGGKLLNSSKQIYLKSAFGEPIKVGQNIYEGYFKLYVKDGRLAMCNILPLESYVRSVLPSEMYSSWNYETLRAGAIVARTYLLYSKGNHREFDICSNVHCQAYRGIGGCTETSDRAVADTAGMVVTYEGEIALTVYTSSSIGKTESSSSCWGSSQEAYPYLCSVDTSFVEETTPYKYWKSVVRNSELAEYIGFSDTITSVDTEKDEAGYVTAMTILSSSGEYKKAKNSQNTRGMVSKYVKSAAFDVRNVYIPSENNTFLNVISAEGEEMLFEESYNVITSAGTKTISGIESAFLFEGSGYGHGVGLSQYTANEMGLCGYTAEDIISTFYPGTQISYLD